jgi:ubiquinone biosynthesis protein COQ4
MERSFRGYVVAATRMRYFVWRGFSAAPMSTGRKYFEPYKLTPSQRLFLAPYFGLGAILDPTRGELVAGLGDATGELQVRHIKNRLMMTPQGRKLLREKPLVTEAGLDFNSLKDLPKGSLGREYFDYMSSHGFHADERSVVRYMTCPDTAYVMARYRQVHDFWHVLSGLPPTVLAEVALKWYELKLTGLPVCALSGLLGPLRLSFSEQRTLATVYLPWVARARSRCEELLIFRYEDNLDMPLDEVRRTLRFEKAPEIR